MLEEIVNHRCLEINFFIDNWQFVVNAESLKVKKNPKAEILFYLM